MALSIIQSASAVQPAQSPIMYSVSTGDSSFTSSQFQYTCLLQYWSGSATDSSSANTYQINKYPNRAGSGLFDFSKILNSTLRQNIIENTSSLIYYKPTFNFQYYTTTWVSGSSVVGTTRGAYDGYAIWPEVINGDISSKGLYPFLTDGPTTQSVFPSDKGTISVDATNASITVQYTGSNGSTGSIVVTGGASTANRFKRIPVGLAEASFPLSKVNLSHFTINTVSKSVRYDVGCEPKYTPVRIGYKNRFGQLDYFTFSKVSRQGFSTTQRTYQPNNGNWNGSTFTVDQYTNQTQRYIVDNQQMISANSDYILEVQNEAFKQLLVSDEIYWYYSNEIIPVSIATSNIVFKTGRVDKLIQYQFDFTIGRNYKQIV